MATAEQALLKYEKSQKSQYNKSCEYRRRDFGMIMRALECQPPFLGDAANAINIITENYFHMYGPKYSC